MITTTNRIRDTANPTATGMTPAMTAVLGVVILFWSTILLLVVEFSWYVYRVVGGSVWDSVEGVEEVGSSRVVEENVDNCEWVDGVVKDIEVSGVEVGWLIGRVVVDPGVGEEVTNTEV